MEAGQYCSFTVHADGTVSACGKGSYGRLGLGDSANQPLPRRVSLDPPCRAVASSKGSDGHTLAVATDGRVYSWGDGDYGKLGHGNTVTQKYPRRVDGPLAGKTVTTVSAGYRHSACVTADGRLYTWGEGEHGRLGHGDNNSRNVPTLVSELSAVGQVDCGSAHTLAVSADGRTVWSFGSGDNGRLGHGDLARQFRPKVIEAFSGLTVVKVAAGNQCSLALTSQAAPGEEAGPLRLWSWGGGVCLGQGSPDVACLRPALVEVLAELRVTDVSLGDSHCLALTQDHEVFAWGNNSMGQCGLGHTNTPVWRPRKVLGLEEVAVRQVSAGTSHSCAWTAPPRDRQAYALSRPYCVSLDETTLGLMHSLLERYCTGLESDRPPLPFGSQQLHLQFLQALLGLLRTHLSLAIRSGLDAGVTGGQARSLRTLLFRLIDTSLPSCLQTAVLEALKIGAPLLLPPLRERMEILHSLLPQGPDCASRLSDGQELQLSMILTSLEEHTQVAALLGYGPAHGTAADPAVALLLMKTLLRNVGFDTERRLVSVERSAPGEAAAEAPTDHSPHLCALLMSLQSHLLAFCYTASCNVDSAEYKSSLGLLQSHLSLLFPLAREAATHALAVLALRPSLTTPVREVLLLSSCGAMLSKVVHALLLLPVSLICSLLGHLTALLPSIDGLVRLTTEQLADPAEQWQWLSDAEQACALLVGRCVGGLLAGPPPLPEEAETARWLASPLLARGMEADGELIGVRLSDLLTCLTRDGQLTAEVSLTRLNRLLDTVAWWSDAQRLGLAAAVGFDKQEYVYEELYEYGVSEGLEPAPDELPRQAELVCRLLLVTLLKHTGCDAATVQQARRGDMDMIYETVYRVRHELLGQFTAESASPRTGRKRHRTRTVTDSDEDERSAEQPRFPAVCTSVARACLFLCLAVVGPGKLDPDALRDQCAEVLKFVCHDWANRRLSYEQFVAGCFGLSAVSAEPPRSRVRFYTDDVATSGCALRQRIHTVLADIYRLLVAGLFRHQDRGAATCAVLPEVRYRLELLGPLAAASMRFLQVLAIIAGVYAESLPASTCDEITELLRRQLARLLDACSRPELESDVITTLCDVGQQPAAGSEDTPQQGAAAKHARAAATSASESTLDSVTASSNGEDSELVTSADESESADQPPDAAGKGSSRPPVWQSRRLTSTARAAESSLGDLLVFVRHVASTASVRRRMTSHAWTGLLLRICGQVPEPGTRRIQALRPRLLALQLLGTVLPSLDTKEDRAYAAQLASELFHQLSDSLWVIPRAVARLVAARRERDLRRRLLRLSSPEWSVEADAAENSVPVHEAGFDSDRCLYCTVENGQTLVHSQGGKGYGLGTTGIKSGCYQWKFLIVRETRGNEGTCVGVARVPIRDYSHRTTSDMWLYRAYSGNVYHGGELASSLPSFTQGDYITCVLDMDSRSLSFGKNGDEPRVAFEDIDAAELFPCVMFYSTNPGEKVKMTDMQLRGSPRDLLAGEPLCAPAAAVLLEAHVALIRTLHSTPAWTEHVNKCLLRRLSRIKELMPTADKDGDSPDTTLHPDSPRDVVWLGET
ncbi:probable E3 ubiquitin-protein ligase HERC1 [Pollicipes pollicipes]|uniref:probable E3 ubiquitin-protein ligase HERC1 n=1 Tax=Pollicipes pollicipes TaxID=41117 RepID=UPI001885842B|nr:probable E3 ubiquitin-protein ligase HERC1 [Pollicipes pollicipes]